MRNLLAQIGRMLSTVFRWVWVGGKAVLQPVIEAGSFFLFSEPSGFYDGPSWLTRGLESVGRKLEPAARATVGLAATGAAAALTGAAGVARGVGRTGDAVLGLPGRILRGAFGGGGGGQQPDEAAVAQQAAAQAQQQQTRADNAQDAREVVQHLRRVLSARSRGQVPDAEHVSRLPAAVAAYVAALSPDECGKLIAMPTARLRDLMGGKPVDGIRTPDEIASAPADELAARRAARREEVRARLRARSVDDVLAEVRMTA